MPRHPKMRTTLGWKISAIGGVAGAALLALSIFLHAGYDPRGMLLFGLIGLTIGAIQGPVFSPESFRFPGLWQGGFGATGAIAVTLLIGLSPEAIVLWGMAGFVLALLGMQLLRVFDHL
jgi:hypothetical protein